MYNSYRAAQWMAAPVNLWASAVRAIWTAPGNPLSQTLLGRSLASASEMFERATRRYGKPAFGLDSTEIAGGHVAVREIEVVKTPFCNLIHFQRDAARSDPKVLLLAPLSGHHASLLRDTVERLLPEHDVYVTDWIDARLVPLSAGGFDLDDYIDLVQRFLQTLGEGVNVIAVCQPGVPALAAVSLMAERGDAAVPRTLTLMAAPIDTRQSPTEVDRAATNHSLKWFETACVHRVPFGHPGFGRKVYPGFLQLNAFIALNPDRHAESHRKHFRDLLGNEEGSAEIAESHRRFYDNYFAMIDLPAEYYLQTVDSVFQKHELARGEMHSRGVRIRPEMIRETALLTIEAEKDDITGLGQTQAAHALCSGIPESRKQHYLQEGAGHYGVFSGHRWREQIAPRIAAFIRS